eukprot:7053589-Prymnesium_polylepis.1
MFSWARRAILIIQASRHSATNSRDAHNEQRLDSWATSAAILHVGILKLWTIRRAATFIYSEERHRRGRFAAGVEPGPMSTTFDRKIAMSYAGDGHGSLFEIAFRADTHAACRSPQRMRTDGVPTWYAARVLSQGGPQSQATAAQAPGDRQSGHSAPENGLQSPHH